MQQIQPQSDVLFAARRFYNKDGSTYLTLVYTKTGARLEENEEVLNRSGIKLGDFLYKSGLSYKWTAPVGGFEVKPVKNVAIVRRVPAKLVDIQRTLVFESEYFGRSKCNVPPFNAKMGNYTVDITLLEEPLKLMTGWELHFDASNALPVYSDPAPLAPQPNRIYGNGFSDYADKKDFNNLTARPADPLDLLQPKFDAQCNLFAPIQPADSFADRAPHNLSPTFSTISTFLPPPPRSPVIPARVLSPPIPKPRTNNNSPVVQQPPQPSLTKFLLAGRRCFFDNKAHLVLIEPKSGEYFIQRESVLNQNGIVLGDWVRARVHAQNPKTLHTFVKAEHTAKLNVKPEGDVAYVANIRCTLVNEQEGHQVFQCALFANSLSKMKLSPGKYFVRISMLDNPYRLPDGSTLFFEGTNARPIVKYSPKPGPPKFNGAGFPDTSEEKTVVVGAGFGEAPSSTVIVGAGFKAKPAQVLKMRAVVMSEVEKDGVPNYYLWILDRQIEGRLVDKMYKLQKGHFFEGTFRENSHGKWECQKYEKALETLVEGGLDRDGNIWFKVKVDKYKEANGNMKFSEAQAKYFGKIVDTEGKLNESCNGRQVKIQRKGVAKGDYVWAVIELL